MFDQTCIIDTNRPTDLASHIFQRFDHQVLNLADNKACKQNEEQCGFSCNEDGGSKRKRNKE